ncbi:M6 family metalloprotease domain-containing protein, partial [Candidatus Bathyarchaeota archaeon]|nr:M6 family metalloprotease domain-containing protein [Candidatus Bathyarchaeota archaeon]
MLSISIILLLSIQIPLQSQESSKVAAQNLNAAGVSQGEQLQLVDKEFYAAGSPGISASPGSFAEYSGREPAPNLPSSPATGTRNVLVILVDFADKVGNTDVTHFQGMLFQETTGSLRNYIKEISYNKLSLSGGVAGSGWYRSLKNMSFWGQDSSQGHDDENAYIFDLAREALTLADNNVDFRAFDTNHDNVLESSELTVFFVHSGQGEEAYPWNASDIWSNFGYVYGQGYMAMNDSALSDLFLDGVRVSKHPDDYVGGYCMVAENSPLGTYAHEFGHSLGLPDLYDGKGGDEYMGKWDLMDEGNWNGNPLGSSPAHPSSWSKLKLGWVDQTATLNSGTITQTIDQLETLTSHPLVLRIPLGSTYYLVEVRQRALYDSALPDKGVLILYCNDSKESGMGPVRLIDSRPEVPNLGLDDAP